MEEKKHFPNMGDKPEPKRRATQRPRKRKKLLRPPTQIIRLFLIFAFVAEIYLLSCNFVTVTSYITEDLKAPLGYDGQYTTLADQKEIDDAAKELKSALDELELLEGKTPAKNSQINQKIQSTTYKWEYHIAKGVKFDELSDLINKANDIYQPYYTEKSIDRLNKATLKAQYAMRAVATISQSPLQLILGGNIGTGDSADSAAVITGKVMLYLLVLLPFAGFLFACFDSRRHIKNVFSVITSGLCIIFIFLMVNPYYAVGSVIALFIYFIIIGLGIGGIYAKQQEDYIIKHPELEAEFSEKHPQFVKALINHKSVSLEEITRKEAELKAAKNAKKSQDKKKSKKQ